MHHFKIPGHKFCICLLLFVVITITLCFPHAFWMEYYIIVIDIYSKATYLLILHPINLHLYSNIIYWKFELRKYIMNFMKERSCNNEDFRTFFKNRKRETGNRGTVDYRQLSHRFRGRFAKRSLKSDTGGVISWNNAFHSLVGGFCQMHSLKLQMNGFMKHPVSNDYRSMYTDFRVDISWNASLKSEAGWVVSWNPVFHFMGMFC